jgi:hypothetical protein
MRGSGYRALEFVGVSTLAFGVMVVAVPRAVSVVVFAGWEMLAVGTECYIGLGHEDLLVVVDGSE